LGCTKWMEDRIYHYGHIVSCHNCTIQMSASISGSSSAKPLKIAQAIFCNVRPTFLGSKNGCLVLFPPTHLSFVTSLFSWGKLPFSWLVLKLQAQELMNV
jgi:hypothetical protein